MIGNATRRRAGLVISIGLAVALVLAPHGPSLAQPAPAARPWMNTALSPDARADLVLRQMTLEEKHALVFGYSGRNQGVHFIASPNALGSAGYVPGAPRLGIPDLQETDAGVGVAWAHGVRPLRKTVSLPSGLATAATWDPAVGFAGGAMIGEEAHRNGFNILLAGGVDLDREPRNGRNFEYGGEDPLLAGTMVGSQIAGIQSRHVAATVKHFAFNDQESGRMTVSSDIAPTAARESDLLAFEIAIETGHPASTMCSYNRVNGVYACENRFLLNDVLKGDWRWPGFVMSDWGADHSTAAAANAGLDQESGESYDDQPFFGAALTQAIAAGQVSPARLDDMAHRILRAMFAVGAFDDPPTQSPMDLTADARVSQADAEQGAVLLKNASGVLPLAPTLRSIAVIGGHADVGVLSGGGSSQVVPPAGVALSVGPALFPGPAIYQASSPLAAIIARAGAAQVRYADGEDVAQAAKLAAASDVVIVFATRWQGEATDAPDLSLPDDQDALIAAVAKANPRTVVVLETGSAVLTPWRDKIAGLLEVWYPGSSGGPAIARLLFGEADPSGRLPITFPGGEAQLPRPVLDGAGVSGQLDSLPRFDVNYDIEGPLVGYKWFETRGLKPAYAFGAGLAYTTFAYAALEAHPDADGLSVSFEVTNTGARVGAATPQIYVGVHPPGEPPHKRLGGWSKLTLRPGERRRVTVHVPARMLAAWDEPAHDWRLAAGDYPVLLAAASDDVKARVVVSMAERRLAP
jgi:beta-glucosidase